MKRNVTTIILGIIPALFTVYCSLPYFQYENGYALLIAAISVVLSGYFIKRYRIYQISKIPFCLSIIFVLITYYYSFLHSFLILAAVLIIFLPFILGKTLEQSIEKTLLVYIILPLSFFTFMIIVAVVIEENIKYLYFSEKQFVTFLVFICVLFTVGYTTSLVFKLFNLILRARDQLSSKKYRILVLISIIVFLILPDGLFSFLTYDLYLHLHSEKTFRFFDIYYYTFSTHFLIPISEIGDDIKSLFLGTDLGMWINILHTLTIRLIDITILASISHLLSKRT